MYSLRRRLPLLSLALPVSAALTICCGNSIATAASSPTAGAPAAKVRATAGPLSGTWSGRYSGAYDGTFTLHWIQSGSQLSGTIKLSTVGSKLVLKGTVRSRVIRFGTVGSTAITYSGTVSGRSMSGSYHTPGGGGSWSAHRTSGQLWVSEARWRRRGRGRRPTLIGCCSVRSHVGSRRAGPS